MSLVFYKYISLSAVPSGKKWISIFKVLLFCLSNGAYKINHHAKGNFSDIFFFFFFKTNTEVCNQWRKNLNFGLFIWKYGKTDEDKRVKYCSGKVLGSGIFLF